MGVLEICFKINLGSDERPKKSLNLLRIFNIVITNLTRLTLQPNEPVLFIYITRILDAVSLWN